MDAPRNSKATLRSLMKGVALKKEKRIDSPLVRYNDSGQPVCKVCNTAVKSESLWVAHVASKAHKEAVERLKQKAKAAGTPGSSRLTQVASSQPLELPVITSQQPVASSSSSVRKASSLPSDFFDAPPAKAIKSEGISPAGGMKPPRAQTQKVAGPAELMTKQENLTKSDKNSSLPEGFFDNKEADTKARGLKVKKIDIQKEMKVFEMAMKDDLQGVDLRQEEEEAEAAEDREKEEEITQRTLLERVDMLRRRKEEQEAALMKKKEAKFDVTNPDSDSSDEDQTDDDDDLIGVNLLDWRARQL